MSSGLKSLPAIDRIFLMRSLRSACCRTTASFSACSLLYSSLSSPLGLRPMSFTLATYFGSHDQ